MEIIIKHVVENKKLDTSKWEHGIEMSSWETNHMIAREECKRIRNYFPSILAEILASRANECYDNISEDIQYLIKKLEKM